MNKERLLKLADYLETVEREEFNMNYWYVEILCKTTACALGHACSIPEFKEAGLRLLQTTSVYSTAVKDYSPEYQGKYNYDAGSRFFDITIKQAKYLFNPDEYEQSEKSEPLAVAKRIRELANS